MKHHVRTLVTAFAVVAPAGIPASALQADRPSAAVPSTTRASEGVGLLAGLDASRVYFDEPGDGRIWVAGDAYKASFGVEGATYIPYFGASAPRNFPVAFRIDSLRVGGVDVDFDACAAPVREGNRILFDRGAVLEAWDLAPRTAEQSFTFRARLHGEIEIGISVESELLRSQEGSELLLANDLGTVRYGTAYALDHRVGRTALASGWSGSSIRIVVPAERVAASDWPLVVDPVLTTWSLSNPVDPASLPDVAYDPVTARSMYVCERVASASDHDVYFQLVLPDGTVDIEGFLDMSSAWWAEPKVAYGGFGAKFLCVAAVGNPTGGARIIRGRQRTGGFSGVITAPVTISGSETGDKHAPDVGGNPSTAGTSNYCVVWQRDVDGTNHDIHACIVNGNGSPITATIPIAATTGTLDNSPAVSKSCGRLSAGAAPLWNVAWQRFQGSFDNDLRAAQIDNSGTVVTPAFYVQSGSANIYAAAPSTPTDDPQRTWLVAASYQTSQFGPLHVHGWVLRGSQVIDSGNLSQLSGASSNEQQSNPGVDCDGAVFVMAAQQTTQMGAGPSDMYISTFHVIGDQLRVAEGNVVLSHTGGPESNVELACAGESGLHAHRTMVAWQNATIGGIATTHGGQYTALEFATFCDPGSDGVQACPCGNPPNGADRGCNNSAHTGGARLHVSGSVSPSDDILLEAFDMLPNASCLFVQGTTVVPAGAVFGDGIRCVGGTFLRLALKTASGGGVAYPLSFESSITHRAALLGAPISPGTDRYYFVYYRDPLSYACAATFNTTNAVRIRW